MKPTNPSATPPAASQSADYRSLVAAGWSQFQALAKVEERADLTASLAPAIRRSELGLFRLVVMGEIKKGKSSFINALLGEPGLLPTASDVATSIVYKLLYGREKKFKVFFLPDVETNRRPELKEVGASDLQLYGTEKGNPKNQKRVDFIGIELPHPLLKEGLVIVDTPGVGGLFKAHRDITWRYAPNADAVCFVLDSVEAVISKDEMDFLQELTRKVTRKIFFVHTKTDAADHEQSQAWEKRNRELLTKHLGIPSERLLYFPVSSKLKAVADTEQKNAAGAVTATENKGKALKHLERSGFPPVLKFLSQGLMKQKEKTIGRQTARQIASACDELDRQMREELRIAQAHSKEELDKIAGELSEAERALTTWERETYPAEMRQFEDAFSRLRLETSGRLRVGLDAVVPVGEIVNQLQVSQPDPQLLNQMAGEFQQAMLSQASEAAMKIEQEFNQQVLQQLKETATRLVAGFSVGAPTLQLQSGGPLPIHIQDNLHINFPVFEKVRYGMMGAGIGLGLTSLLTVIFPPAGAIAGFLALAGGWIGGREGWKLLDAQKRAEVITKLQQKLTETMMRASSQAQQHFAEIAQQLEQFARNTFADAAKRARTDLQNRIRDVQSARSRNANDAQAKVKELQARLQRLSALKELLRPLLPNRAPAAP